MYLLIHEQEKGRLNLKRLKRVGRTSFTNKWLRLSEHNIVFVFPVSNILKKKPSSTLFLLLSRVRQGMRRTMQMKIWIFAGWLAFTFCHTILHLLQLVS